jgi:hypothetical protein
MMKTVLTCFFFTLSSLYTLAQDAGTRITGLITNSEGKPVEAASVTLIRAAEKKIVKIAITNTQGEYEFVGTKPGAYLIQVTATGYNAGAAAPFEIKEGQDNYVPEIAPLAMAEKSLGNVTVTGRKPIVENKIDRMVVNVESMISSAGSNALEVLEKSPGIMVDRDGNISLKGKQGVIVLLDGRPTYLSGTDLANMLRNMPSSELDQIEIMTQPPAKYDASGNAGLLNIRTKKSKANGFNGSASVSYVQGRYPKSPNSLSLNWRHNKVNLFANYGFSYWEGFNDINILRKFGTAPNQTIFNQDTYGHSYGRNHNAKVGMDFYADKKTTFGVVVNGTVNPRDFYSDGEARISGADMVVDSINLASSHNHDSWKNLGVNFNFRKVLDSKGSEITADADYVWYGTQTNQNSDNNMVYPDGTPVGDPFLIKGDLPSDIRIYSIKSDYTRKLTNGARFDAGIKSSLVKTDNNAKYYIYDKTHSDWVIDDTRSNHFLYDENINAIYVNYNQQFKKWGIQTGLRLENTIGRGEQITTKEVFKRNYTQLFPTLYVSHKPNDKHTFAFTYGRRIERPNYQDMNPFQFFLDQFTYRQGNPYLLPQFSNNLELSHNFKGALNTTLNYTYTSDIINDILKQDDDTKVTYQTKENIGNRTNIGLAISYNAPIKKWYTISFYANPYYNRYQGMVNNLPLDVSMVSFMVNMNNQFRFGKGWGAEVSGFYRSKTQDAGIIIANPMGVVNFAFSKQIIQGKGSLRLALNDPFWIQRFSGYTKFGNINTEIKSQWDNRRVGLTFTYRFGKQMQQAPRRRNGGATEEQQRVGGGNQNG